MEAGGSAAEGGRRNSLLPDYTRRINFFCVETPGFCCANSFKNTREGGSSEGEAEAAGGDPPPHLFNHPVSEPKK